MHAHITHASELVKQLRFPQQLVSVLYTNVQSVANVHGFRSSCDLHATKSNSLNSVCSKWWYTHAHTKSNSLNSVCSKWWYTHAHTKSNSLNSVCSKWWYTHAHTKSNSLNSVCSKRWYTHAHTTLRASLSCTLPPNSAVTGYATEGALLIFARLSAWIAPTSLTLSVPSLQFVKGMSTKAVEVTQQQQQKSSRKTNQKSMWTLGMSAPAKTLALSQFKW